MNLECVAERREPRQQEYAFRAGGMFYRSENAGKELEERGSNWEDGPETLGGVYFPANGAKIERTGESSFWPEEI